MGQSWRILRWRNRPPRYGDFLEAVAAPKRGVRKRSLNTSEFIQFGNIRSLRRRATLTQATTCYQYLAYVVAELLYDAFARTGSAL